MSFSRPGKDLVTGYLAGDENFGRDYLLERSLELAREAAMLPEVYVFETPEGYLDYIQAEGGREFGNLAGFEEWVEGDSHEGRSVVLELYPVGDHESRVITAYEERQHVEGVMDWPSSVPREFDSKIEINAQGDKYRSVMKIIDQHFPELRGES